MNFTIDIESIPCQQEGIVETFKKEIIDNLNPPGNIKKQETLDKWFATEIANADKNAETKWIKTSLDANYGEIICISYAIDDEPPVNVMRHLDESEAGLLITFYKSASKAIGMSIPMMIGHNICGFDLKYIWKRSVINNVHPTIPLYHDARPWSDRVFDTMHEWDSTKMISMDNLCKLLGIEGKDGFDGSMVWQAIKDGEYEKVAEYCNNDCIKARKIFKRLQFMD